MPPEYPKPPIDVACERLHPILEAEISEPIGDREYGLRDYGVRDLNGYQLSFGHYIDGA